MFAETTQDSPNTEALTYIANPAAEDGIELILRWIGLEVTRVRSLDDLSSRLASKRFGLIVSQTNRISQIRRQTTVQIVNADQFMFRDLSTEHQWPVACRFNAAGFVDSIRCLTSILEPLAARHLTRQQANPALWRRHQPQVF